MARDLWEGQARNRRPWDAIRQHPGRHSRRRRFPPLSTGLDPGRLGEATYETLVSSEPATRKPGRVIGRGRMGASVGASGCRAL